MDRPLFRIGFFMLLFFWMRIIVERNEDQVPEMCLLL